MYIQFGPVHKKSSTGMQLRSNSTIHLDDRKNWTKVGYSVSFLNEYCRPKIFLQNLCIDYNKSHEESKEEARIHIRVEPQKKY